MSSSTSPVAAAANRAKARANWPDSRIGTSSRQCSPSRRSAGGTRGPAPRLTRAHDASKRGRAFRPAPLLCRCRSQTVTAGRSPHKPRRPRSRPCLARPRWPRSRRQVSRAERTSVTFSRRELWPIRPIRQAFPLNGPSPPPISMPQSLSSRFRTGQVVDAVGNPDAGQLRQPMAFGGRQAQAHRGQARLKRTAVLRVPGDASLEPLESDQREGLAQGVVHADRRGVVVEPVAPPVAAGSSSGRDTSSAPWSSAGSRPRRLAGRASRAPAPAGHSGTSGSRSRSRRSPSRRFRPEHRPAR